MAEVNIEDLKAKADKGTKEIEGLIHQLQQMGVQPGGLGESRHEIMLHFFHDSGFIPDEIWYGALIHYNDMAVEDLTKVVVQVQQQQRRQRQAGLATPQPPRLIVPGH